jgi:hypothetical protein
VAAFLGVMAVVAVIRSPKGSARLAMAASGLLAFWVLTLVARGASQATPIRYLYPAAALILVGVGELPSLIARTTPTRLSSAAPRWARIVAGGAALVVVAFVPLAIWWNSDVLNSGGAGLSAADTQVRAEQGALVLAGSTLPAGYQPDNVVMPQVTVGWFLKAVAQFGSPGDSADTLKKAGAATRTAIDNMLLRGRPMSVTSATPASGAAENLCEFRPVGGGEPPLVVKLPASGIRVTAPPTAGLAIRVKWLSSAFPLTPLATGIGAGSTSIIKWSASGHSISWEVELTPVPVPAASGSFATICK